ncbi:large conductance mechanosensitive channel protein MscL [Microbacterium protaetiae]|uniref:Large-conductance mechanosensitive channel n=1 Tax=Microbacterium protaetiae TaxID=2509458 RepID=A0A4P6EEH2_9MICO|nr:large conductance mechanosensitive channel protein MscL [Microbacterium protaetiae]QAY60730.1 large conductance mechanosensitive channel protein MscL [Microbacterium protaetiae]
MIKGFKEFIAQGNVIDLAVAVVIGTAFSAVVTAIVESIINPLISLFWKADASGKIGFTIHGLYGDVVFPIGTLITALISFLAIAVVVYFVFVYPMNTFKERRAAKLAAGITDEPEALPTEQELLVQIRDLLEKQKD